MKRFNSKKAVLLVVLLAIFTDMLMYGLVVPFLPIYAANLGASEAAVGLLLASYGASLFIGTPIAGFLADRFGSKQMLIWGLLGLAIATLVFIFATSFWLIVVARLLQGFAAAIPWTAGLALLAKTFPQAEQGKAMGLAISGQSAGMLLGPTVGGWLFDIGGFQLPFMILSAIIFIVALLSMFLLRHVKEKTASSFTSPFVVLRNKNVLIIVGAAAIGASVIASLETRMPFHYDTVFATSAAGIGLLFLVITLTLGAFSPIIGALSTKLGELKTMMAGLILTSITLPLTVLPKSMFLQVITLILLGISIVTLTVPALPKLTAITLKIDAVSQGTTMSAYNTAYSTGLILGPLVSSLLVGPFGLMMTFCIMSISLLVYLWPLTIVQRKGTS
ncbi:MFS transporter [Bacillus sp. FSL W7-1360]